LVEPQWDHTLLHDPSGAPSEIRQIFQKAIKTTLPAQVQTQVVQALQADLKLVFQLGLTPKRLPELVREGVL
jgi:hypothetical protein